MDPDRIGKYEIVGRVGHGAMGVVYKAYDSVLGRFVAIKTISARLLGDEHSRQRFQREARSAAQLNHPNIVTVFEFGEEGTQTYLVMELLQGKDLKQIIARRAITTVDEALAIVEQILDGLSFAHAKDLIHRDLKPANIHVLPGGAVKILDFGLARLGGSEITRAGTIIGTPHYMSPEQVRAEKLDRRSDIFSVGSILYELLAGRKAFAGESVHSVLFNVVDGNPVPLGSQSVGVPLELQSIVDRALAKATVDRYPSADEMLADVRAVRRSLAAGEARVITAHDASVSAPTLIDGRTGGSSLDPATSTLSAGSSIRAVLVAAGTEPPPMDGALALKASDSARPGTDRTSRPDSTLKAFFVGSWTAKSRLTIGLMAAVVLATLAALVSTVLRRGPPPSSVHVLSERRAALLNALVQSRVALARADMQNKDFRDAVKQAEAARDLDPANAEARQILSRVQETLASTEAAAQEAKAAFLERGDLEAASQALGRVLAVDPRHPVAAELGSALNQRFQTRAQEAKRAAVAARREAERAKVTGTSSFLAADRLLKEADGLLQKEGFAVATQRFLEAADAFGRAGRSAATAAAVAAADNAAAKVSGLASQDPSGRGGGPGPAGPAISAPPGGPPATHEPAPDSLPSSALPAGPMAPVAPAALPSAELQPGSLRVLAKPWAEVSIDEVKHGRTPLRSVSVGAGLHAVVLVHPDYQPLRRVVTVKSGELTILNIDMRDEALRKR
jgi:serine/threonine-protein kinase